MKLTPLDIHHKEFRHSLRGYSEEEVDQFLDDVADEFERLFKENIDLSEKLEAATTALKGFQEQEQTIRNTMVAAQRSAEDIMNKSREESMTVLRDAEIKAKEIIHNALGQKQKVQVELVRIKQAEEEFRNRFRQLLEGHVQGINEIQLPDDVNVMMGQTDEGAVGAVEIAAAQAVEAVQASADAVAPSPEIAPPVESQPAVAEQPPQEEPFLAGEASIDMGDEPPESGFVTGVILGETAEPEIEPETDLEVEAPEFDPMNFASLGEREDDLDIEEID